jgi:hypothetical protein
MREYWVRFAADVLPGVTLIFVGALSALPAHRIVRRQRPGRARSAIGYLSGFALGLSTSVLLGLIVGAAKETGLLAAFFGPFIGMARAKWERPIRRPRSSKPRRSRRNNQVAVVDRGLAPSLAAAASGASNYRGTPQSTGQAWQPTPPG